MITDQQKWMLDQKDEVSLKSQISRLQSSNHTNKDSLIEYCESRLEKLNLAGAMVEFTEINPGEVE